MKEINFYPTAVAAKNGRKKVCCTLERAQIGNCGQNGIGIYGKELFSLISSVQEWEFVNLTFKLTHNKNKVLQPALNSHTNLKKAKNFKPFPYRRRLCRVSHPWKGKKKLLLCHSRQMNTL